MCILIVVSLDAYEPIIYDLKSIFTGTEEECINQKEKIINEITTIRDNRIKICTDYINEKGLDFFPTTFRGSKYWPTKDQTNSIINQLLYSGYLMNYLELKEKLPERHPYELYTQFFIVEFKFK